jgi:hypothetical protein
MNSYTKLEPNKEQASKEDIKLFQMLIGSLLYIMLGTRVDIAFTIIKLARFASNPSNIHFTAVKRVYKYLKGTKQHTLFSGFLPPYFHTHTSPTFRTHSIHLSPLAPGSRTYYK